MQEDQRDFYQDVSVTPEGVLLVNYPEGLTTLVEDLGDVCNDMTNKINDMCEEEVNRPRRITMTCGNPPPPHSLKLKQRPITRVIKGMCRGSKNL